MEKEYTVQKDFATEEGVAHSEGDVISMEEEHAAKYVESGDLAEKQG